jgi:hypothetical protein
MLLAWVLSGLYRRINRLVSLHVPAFWNMNVLDRNIEL